MSTYEKISGVIVFSLILAFIAPIMSCVFGAMAGWVVGLVFSDTILDFLGRLGVNTAGLTMWQVGAGLGFVGGYLKTTVHQKN